MSELIRDLGTPTNFVKPESMLVIKSTKRSYPAYYNVYKHSWGGLLDATIYTGNEVPEIPDSEVVDYRKEVGLIK